MDVRNVLGLHINLNLVHQHLLHSVFPIKSYFPIIQDLSNNKKINYYNYYLLIFRTLTRNIRLRCNAKVALNVPSMYKTIKHILHI